MHGSAVGEDRECSEGPQSGVHLLGKALVVAVAADL